MNIIKENPFRILGLAANATERELQKRISTIKRYAEIGKTQTFEFDLTFICEVNRNLENTVKAAAKIEQANKKIIFSLFWFINNTNIDEVALNHLKGNNIKKAYEIWQKTLKDDVTANNFSAYQNISTLLLTLGTDNNNIDLKYLTKGVYLKEIFLKSDYFSDYVKLITGKQNSNTKNIIEKFSDEIIDGLKPYKTKIAAAEIVSLFSYCSPDIQKYVKEKFAQTPIANIEKYIEITINRREKNPEKANIFAEELFQNCEKDLSLLKNISGENSPLYNLLANKLANEILQCSIKYYNKEYENNADAWEIAYKTVNLALKTGTTGHVKDKITKSIDQLKRLEFQEYDNLYQLLESIAEAIIKLKSNIDKNKVNDIIIKEVDKEILKTYAEKKDFENTKNLYHFLALISQIVKTPYIKGLVKVFYKSLPANSNIKKYVGSEIAKERKAKIKKILIFTSIFLSITFIIWFFAGMKGIGFFALLLIIILITILENKT